MSAVPQLQPEQQRLLGRAVELAAESEPARLAEEHPLLRDPAVVQALCDEATKLVRVDVRKAERVAELSSELADSLADPFLRGRSRRARANVLHVRGEFEAALGQYEEAIRLFEELGLELEVGITRSTALQTLAYVGQHDRSFDWADRARQTFEEQRDELRLGRLDLNLGNIVYRQERFEEARKLMERAYDRLLTVGGPADVAHCLRNLATVHIGLKNFREAEDVYSRARAYCEKEDLPLLLGEVEYNIAYLYYLRGDYPTALELYRRTRERCEATGEIYHRALCDLDEAEMYLELNLVDEALRSTDAAYRSFDQLGMRYEAAKALSYLAIARIRQGKTILGLDIFDRARDIFVEERNEIWLGLIDLYKAMALAREGRRFEAEGLLSVAQGVFAAGGLESKIAASETLGARLRLQSSDLEAARRLCNRAVARLSSLELPSLEHPALYILGRIEEEAGNTASALAAYEASHHKLARSRATSQVDELKIPLLQNNLEVYESLVRLLVEGQPSDEAESVFGYMEIAKARNLIDLLSSRGMALPSRQARSAQVERLRRLREELNWYYRRIDVQEMALEDPSAEELEELRGQTRATEAALEESLREVEIADPEFASLQTASAASPDEIVKSLPADAALIEFYCARGTIYACTLSDRHGLQVVPVTLESRALDLQRRLADQLLKFRLGAEHVERHAEGIQHATDEILHDLYEELVAPLEQQMADLSQLVVVPHGSLHWLPFPALHDGTGYLVDRFAVTYAPTATVFHHSQNRAAPEAFGHLFVATNDEAAVEARSLAGEIGPSRVLLGSEATAGALREFADGCKVLHLATTADYRSDNPMFSALQLADGSLSLFDLCGLKLNVELAVLSGCGRGHAAPSGGDEWLGLARGLLYAGARSALLSLWNPSAVHRTELLEGFYRRLSSAATRSEALRQAMLDVKEQQGHPFYWASFALIGHCGPIEL